jgi:hypothetical protein
MGDARIVRSVLGSSRGEQPSCPMPLLQGAGSEKMGVAEMEALMEMRHGLCCPEERKGGKAVDGADKRSTGSRVRALARFAMTVDR